MTPGMCLAIAIFFEARAEPFDGKLAVGDVIITRVEDRRYPSDICSVMTEDRGPKKHDCQFSFYCDGLSDDPAKYNTHFDAIAWKESQEAADIVLKDEYDIKLGATLYHAKSVTPYWSKSNKVQYIGKIGNHLFYSEK